MQFSLDTYRSLLFVHRGPAGLVWMLGGGLATSSILPHDHKAIDGFI
jgi:hypothetical protein